LNFTLRRFSLLYLCVNNWKSVGNEAWLLSGIYGRISNCILPTQRTVVRCRRVAAVKNKESAALNNATASHLQQQQKNKYNKLKRNK